MVPFLCMGFTALVHRCKLGVLVILSLGEMTVHARFTALLFTHKLLYYLVLFSAIPLSDLET